MKGLNGSLLQFKFQIYFKLILDKETVLCKDKQREITLLLKLHHSSKKEGEAGNLQII